MKGIHLNCNEDKKFSKIFYVYVYSIKVMKRLILISRLPNMDLLYLFSFELFHVDRQASCPEQLMFI